jgi:GT2 family glycosyltransferase
LGRRNLSATGNGLDIIPVLILNWNGEQDSIECLKSIRESAQAGFVPVLIDNGSESLSLERLKHGCTQIYPEVLFLRRSDVSPGDQALRTRILDHLGENSMVFIENGENLGFAKGNNVGVRLATIAGADWVMLLNNDTEVAPNAFRELRSFQSANPSVFAITPQIRYFHPSTKIQNCGGSLTYFGSRKYAYANTDASAVDETTHSTISFATGCALLFKHVLTGPLTEDFFFGEEDYEFSLRMQKRGLTMACAHHAIVFHKVGTSITRASTTLGAILVNYACRLINTRNYYSRIRWHTTRVLAYLYLPVVLFKNGINLRKALFAARIVDSYIRRHTGMGAAEFRSMIAINE